MSFRDHPASARAPLSRSDASNRAALLSSAALGLLLACGLTTTAMAALANQPVVANGGMGGGSDGGAGGVVGVDNGNGAGAGGSATGVTGGGGGGNAGFQGGNGNFTDAPLGVGVGGAAGQPGGGGTEGFPTNSGSGSISGTGGGGGGGSAATPGAGGGGGGAGATGSYVGVDDGGTNGANYESATVVYGGHGGAAGGNGAGAAGGAGGSGGESDVFIDSAGSGATATANGGNGGSGGNGAPTGGTGGQGGDGGYADAETFPGRNGQGGPALSTANGGTGGNGGAGGAGIVVRGGGFVNLNGPFTGGGGGQGGAGGGNNDTDDNVGNGQYTGAYAAAQTSDGSSSATAVANGGTGGNGGGGGAGVIVGGSISLLGPATGGNGGAGGAGGIAGAETSTESGSSATATATGGNGGVGGMGGAGISVAGDGSVVNLSGNAIGGGMGGAGGAGGTANASAPAATTTATATATAIGGAGGSGGAGGNAVMIAGNGVVLNNVVTLTGGTGGTGGNGGGYVAPGDFPFNAVTANATGASTRVTSIGGTGGAGGGGGVAALLTGTGATFSNAAPVSGGNGGVGGNGGDALIGNFKGGGRGNGDSGAGGTGGNGGTGGVGVAFTGAGGTFNNINTVTGGNGGNGGNAGVFTDLNSRSGGSGNGGAGGYGGTGLILAGPGATLNNAGTITGGSGGYGGAAGANTLGFATFAPGTAGAAGVGGIGVLATGATLNNINGGTISGGNGGAGGGAGGTGIVGANLSIANTGGTINGGFTNVAAVPVAATAPALFKVFALGPGAPVSPVSSNPAAPFTAGAQGYAIQFTGGTNYVGTGGTINGGIYVLGGSFQPALPGSTPGTALAVNGPINFAPGTFYNVRLTPAVSDLAVATGGATLNGATVNANFADGIYQQRRYTILTANQGVNGQFSGLNTNSVSAFLHPFLSYDANDVYINIAPTNAVVSPTGRRLPNYVPAAITYNQIAVASGLTQGGIQNGGRGPILNALNQLSAAQARNAFDALSGEGITAAQNIANRSAELFTSSIFDQTTFYGSGNAGNSITLTEPIRELADVPTRAAPPVFVQPNRTWRAWATGFGGVDDIHGNGQIGSSYQQNTIYGGTLGVDYQLMPNYLVGVAIGGTNGDFLVPGRATSGLTTGGHVAFYDLATFGSFYGASSTSFSYFGNRATRTVSGFGGLGTETERADFNSNEFRSRLEFGRHLAGYSGVLTPFVALELAELRSNGFTESAVQGPGLFRLNVSGQSQASAPAFVGVRLQRATSLGNGITLSPTLQVAYVHEFAPYRSQIGTLADLPGSTFLVDGARPARNAAQVKAGAEMAIGARSVIFANFDGEFSGVNQLYAGKGGFRYSW